MTPLAAASNVRCQRCHQLAVSLTSFQASARMPVSATASSIPWAEFFRDRIHRHLRLEDIDEVKFFLPPVAAETDTSSAQSMPWMR
jgi:hypothetical protein